MLHTVIVKVRHKQITVIGHCNTSGRVKLARPLAGAANDPQRLASQAEHLNPVVHILWHVEFVVVYGQVHRPPKFPEFITGGAERPFEAPLVIENLDTPVAGIGHEHFGVCYRNPGGVVELPRATAFFTPGLYQ